jgi:hypothetical protein
LDTVERGPVVLLALPFRYRYKIHCAYEAICLAGAGAACRSAHYESVDLSFHRVRNRPDQSWPLSAGRSWTGTNGMQLQRCVQPPWSE